MVVHSQTAGSSYSDSVAKYKCDALIKVAMMSFVVRERRNPIDGLVGIRTHSRDHPNPVFASSPSSFIQLFRKSIHILCTRPATSLFIARLISYNLQRGFVFYLPAFSIIPCLLSNSFFSPIILVLIFRGGSVLNPSPLTVHLFPFLSFPRAAAKMQCSFLLSLVRHPGLI